MPTSGLYPDIQIEEGEQTVNYSKEGVKARRTFKLNGANNNTPSSTLYDVLFILGQQNPSPFDIPLRGSPHPTITIPSDWNSKNSFCADNFRIKAITSTQVMLEVDYSILNGMTQEPTTDKTSDNALALLTIASSVQTVETSTDIAGNSLIVPYASPLPVLYNIYSQGNTGSQFVPSTTSTWNPTFIPGSPSSKVTAQIQIPNMLLRFQRREKQPRNPNGYVGYVNSSGSGWNLAPWSIGTLSDQTALCTRIENITLDDGITYIVTYEFQIGQLQSIPTSTNPVYPAQFAKPATSINGKLSPWQAVGFYTVSGVGGEVAFTGPPVGGGPSQLLVQQGQIPPDAVPTIFQIYPTVDFSLSTTLSLPGTPGS